MQTLMLYSKEKQIVQKHNLFSEASLLSGVMLDTIEDIIIKKGKPFSKGKFNFIQLEEEIELFPSFLVIANDYDEVSLLEKYRNIEKSILKWHPYCQQIFFNSKKIEQFFDKYLRLNNKECETNCEALVHITSLKECLIHVYNVSNFEKSLDYIKYNIAIQLEYEFSKIYKALVSNLNFIATENIDKSIYLKVKFFVDNSIDIDIQINDIKIIDISNFHLIEGSKTLLEYMYDDLMQIKRVQNSSIGSNNKNYIRACRELGVECEPVTRNMYFLKKDRKKAVYIPYHRTVQTKTVIDCAGSKVLTNEVLEEKGFKVNKHLTISIKDINDEMISETFKKLIPPYVIKPIDQSAGYGVFLNITNIQIFQNAIDELKQLEKVNQIIIEEQFSGTLYRFMVIGDNVVAVLKASYPVLCGNGKNTLVELIKQYNSVNRRKIKMDDSTKLYLTSLGLAPNTVLDNGKTIIASLKKNGDVIQNVTSFVNEKYKKIAVEVNNSFGLKINGVDMMIDENGEYRIIELNPVPALYPHLAPMYGESLDIFKQVIEYVLDNASNEIYDCSDIINYHN